MRQYFRTTQRIAPGLSYVSYQKPGEYFVGVLITIGIIIACIAYVFQSPFVWLVLAFVTISLINAIIGKKLVKSILWLVAFFVTGHFAWIQSGCVGNAGYCVQLAAERAAQERADAAARAEQRIEGCAASTDWHSDADCQIYSAQEIASAKARINARDAQATAEREAKDRQQEAERRARLLQDRDTARNSRR